MSRLTNAEVCSSASNAKRRRLLTGASSAALSLALVLPAGAAFAQAPVATNPNGGAPSTGATQEVGTVVVTGSRIQRRDYTSNSPIVTLSSQNLLQQSDLQIQDTLNKLPQFSPDQNLMGQNAGDVQATPTHSIGISTASLRGLGSNRNLVLVDSRRGAPVNASLVVDLNNIPTALIDRVETITGGASATYGADAIGGVVNFILKRNFQGVDLDLQYGFSQAGDGRQFQASAVFGTNFADDKGNITFFIERMQSDASKQQNHEFYRKGWADPNTTSSSFFNYGTYYAPNNGVLLNGQRVEGGPPSQAAVNALFPNAQDTILANGQVTLSGPAAQVGVTNNFYVLGNKVYGGIGGNPGAVSTVPYPIDGQEWAKYNCLDAAHGNVLGTCVKSNSTIGQIQAPLDRYSFFTNGHYDFTDWLTAEFSGSFDRTHTVTVLTAPISVIDGWNVFIPYDSATGGVASGHPVPQQLQSLLNSRTNPNAPWDLSWLPNLDGPLAPRGQDVTNQVFQVMAGLKGKIPGSTSFTKDWTWSAWATHSESNEYNVATGNFSLQRLRALLLANNWGQTGPGQFVGGVGNSTQPSGSTVPGGIGTIPTTNPGFGIATATCATGMYDLLFNNVLPSKDCLAAIAAPLQTTNITKQDQIEFDLSGSLFKLPAGDLKFAVGGDYRRDQNVFNPDILQSYGSFIDQSIGLYAEPYQNNAQDVKEGYAELEIPVLADLPFVKSFTLNPGARYSTYSTSPGGWTYKIMGDYAVNDWLRLRGGYNLSVRTPNLGELFQGKTQLFTGPGTLYGDACSLLSTAPYGAGGANRTNIGTGTPLTGPTGPANAAAGITPVNANAQSAYLICRATMGTAANQFYDDPTTAQPAVAPSGIGFVNVQGNPALIPEEAKTYTAGLVLRSPFQNDWVRTLTVSVDYYKIHIDHAIEYTAPDYVYQQCLAGATVTTAAQAAAYVASNPYCNSNTGVFRNSTGGIASTNTPDANLATIDTSGVDVTIDWRVPLSLAWKTLPGTFSVSVNSTFLGNYDTTNNPGAAVNHWYGTLGPTLTGTNPGAYAYKINTTFGYNVGPANFSLNWRHLPQVNTNSPLGTPGVRTLPTSGYDNFDLNAFLQLPHGLQLRGGISNIFDKAPPTTGSTIPAINGAGVTTVLASSGQGTTNSSYYDVMGRRFYIGLKARF
ncbi:MAG: TonB-dependent receptor domain-containing protein [Caulobacteraceae bacterium]